MVGRVLRRSCAQPTSSQHAPSVHPYILGTSKPTYMTARALCQCCYHPCCHTSLRSHLTRVVYADRQLHQSCTGAYVDALPGHLMFCSLYDVGSIEVTVAHLYIYSEFPSLVSIHRSLPLVIRCTRLFERTSLTRQDGMAVGNRRCASRRAIRPVHRCCYGNPLLSKTDIGSNRSSMSTQADGPAD